MWSRVLRRLLLTSAIVCLFLCVAPRLARAQAALTIYQENSLPRVNADGSDRQKRPLNLTPEGVNYQDCLDNAKIRFPLQMSGFTAGGFVEVWAGLSGEACTTNTSRTSANRVCWKLRSVDLTLNQNVDIPVRTIMSGIRSAITPDDSASICGAVDLTNVAVNFLYFAPGQTNDSASSKSVGIQIDTVGPSAPSGLRALPGNTRVAMQWDNISGEGGVSILTGIRLYCDPNHGRSIPQVKACEKLILERQNAPLTPTDAGTDAGADAGDASTDSGILAAIQADGTCVDEFDDAGNKTFDCATVTGTGGTCESENLAPSGAAISPTAAFNECFGCGSVIGNTGTSVAAGTLRGAPLVNGTTYAISVAATDAFDNVGPLSTPLCEYPEETNEFWADYRAAGGNAGGGCNTATSESPVGTLAVLGTSVAVVISALRRRKGKKKK